MKMNKITKNIVAAFAGLSMLVSCNLDLEPTTAIVYDENEPLFQSENDIESFYLGVLASYRSLCSGSFDMTADVMVDYFNATTGFGNNYGAVHRADNSFTPSDEYTESVWASHYSAIKNYNIAIREAENVKDSTLIPAAEELQAVAYFCRASAYLTLTRLFGEVYDPDTAEDELSVPLVLEYNLNYVPVRSTVAEVYDQIDNDLYFAEKVFSQAGRGFDSAVQAPYPTYDALKALYARYYLDVQEYDQAFKMAKSVIESAAGYALASTKNEMLAEMNDSGSEPIVQMYASMSEGTISKSIYTMVGYNDDMGKYFAPYYLPSRTLIDAYESSDYRFTTWFSNIKYPVFMNGSYYDGIYTFIRYIGNPQYYTGLIESSVNAAKPLTISEMYLIAAEAAWHNGSALNANKYLNELQAARNTTKTNAMDSEMENIKTEWFKEMVGNGQRLICLKRWGDGIPARPAQPEALDANAVMTGAAYTERTVEPGEYIFNYPIPAYEIQVTPSLEQNRGYSAK